LGGERVREGRAEDGPRRAVRLAQLGAEEARPLAHLPRDDAEGVVGEVEEEGRLAVVAAPAVCDGAESADMSRQRGG
jgi:hypothetical protein